MSAAPSSQPEAVPEPGPRLLPPVHYGRSAAALAVLGLLAGLALSLAWNENLQWGVVGRYLFATRIMEGVVNTLVLTVLSMGVAVILGILLAVLGMSANPVLFWTAQGYIWFFRGVPLLVQLVFWFNLALVFPNIGIVLPAFGIDWSVSTNDLISSFIASLLGLALHEAAYMAEIVRAGLLGVDAGQTEAARSLGMTDGRLLRRVVLPQAMRIIVPPTGNQVISLLKATSLVAFIAGGDLMTAVQDVYTHNFRVVPLLIVATAWYLAITSVATLLQRQIEKRYGQGFATAARRVGRN